MPSTSPGNAYVQILPGAPTPSLQCVTTFVYRQKRYIVYISGRQLNILTGPTTFVQALTFRCNLRAVVADESTGKIAVTAGKSNIFILEPRTEGWSKVWWEKNLALQKEDDEDEARCLSWGSIGEILVGGSKQLSLYSTAPVSRVASPDTPQPDGETMHRRGPLWSKAVALPVSQASFSPSGGLIATTGGRDKLVKIWRRLSFEEALFDYCYLPHGGVVTHLEWRPLNLHAEERRGSRVSGRHDEDPEVLYTIASDGMLRVWRTGGLHDLEIVALHTSMDLVGAIPQSPSLSSKAGLARPARYACILSFDAFCDAVTASVGRQLGGGQISHSLEHLKEVITQSPDVVLTLDGQGRMSAWGLQSIGHKRRTDRPDGDVPFHIAHAEGLNLKITENANATLTSWFEEDAFNLIVHDLAGGVSWWRGSTEMYFSPAAAAEERLRCVANWTGLIEDVKNMRFDHNDSDLVLWDTRGEMTCLRVCGDALQLTSSSEKAEPPSITSEVSTEDYQTGISQPAIIIANSELVAAVSSNGKDLIVLEKTDGHIEHKQKLDKEVTRLAFFSPAPQHNFLAIGYDNRIEMLIQDRYKQHPLNAYAWTRVKTISVDGLGLNISAVEWLPDGRLAVAVGNGILIVHNHIPLADLLPELLESLNLDGEKSRTVTISSLSSPLRRHLPLWHPDLLTLLVYHGKTNTAAGLLRKLLAKLKFWSEGDELQILADVDVATLIDESQNRESYVLDRDLIDELLEQLAEKGLPMLSVPEQDRLKRVVQTIAYICEHVHGLDVFAIRYLFEWKFQLLLRSAEASNSSSVEDLIPQMQWREIAFVYHSMTQQALIDILVLHHDNKITWPIARALGLTAWVTDRDALGTIFEALAQSAYRASDPPDPTNASLYFLALHKKTTLLGLWRIATWHKEQRATVNFLKRDFEKSDAKTAAKKNAYALMSKRRFDYAAAFFLLANDPASAVGVLASQCEDVMLAVAVARLYGTGIERLIVDRLLPQALQDGDRWYTSWCHTIISQPQQAASVLVRPLDGPVTWWQDDPFTLLLYRHLCKKVPSETEEYPAVLRTARMLHRMGLSLMALDLMKNWNFTHAPRLSTLASKGEETITAPHTNGVSSGGVNSDQPSMLDAFNPSVPSQPDKQKQPSISDAFAPQTPLVDEKAEREAKAAELLAKLRAKKPISSYQNAATNQEHKREPTQFKEPDANSLLDSFGF